MVLGPFLSHPRGFVPAAQISYFRHLLQSTTLPPDAPASRGRLAAAQEGGELRGALFILFCGRRPTSGVVRPSVFTLFPVRPAVISTGQAIFSWRLEQPPDAPPPRACSSSRAGALHIYIFMAIYSSYSRAGADIAAPALGSGRRAGGVPPLSFPPFSRRGVMPSGGGLPPGSCLPSRPGHRPWPPAWLPHSFTRMLIISAFDFLGWLSHMLVGVSACVLAFGGPAHVFGGPAHP